MQDIRTGRHLVHGLHEHLVFGTKYRRDVLSDYGKRDLKDIFSKVCRDFEAELIECNGEDDPIHLLVIYPPKVALSKLVNSLKGVSSRRLREIRPQITGRDRMAFYGLRPISSPGAVAPPCPSSVSMSDHKEKRPPAAPLSLPGLKAGLSRGGKDERDPDAATFQCGSKSRWIYGIHAALRSASGGRVACMLARASIRPIGWCG